jgi:hypothetical protein
MSYNRRLIWLTEALALLAERNIAEPANELLMALKEQEVRAWGLADGSRKEIPADWWFHLNSELDCDTVWFDRRSTTPPTPFRVEQIELLRADIERLWPEAPAEGNASAPIARPEATLQRLRIWARERWPNGDLPGRDDLLSIARNEFDSVSEHRHIRELRRSLASEKSRKGGAPSHRAPNR